MTPNPDAPFYRLQQHQWWAMAVWTQVEERPTEPLDDWEGGDDSTPIVHTGAGRFWVWEEAYAPVGGRRQLWGQKFDDVMVANP